MGIIYEKKGHIAYITIDNPDKGNILDHQTSDEISKAWKNTWEDRDVRVTILTGTGDRHFCAGHNLAPPPGVSAHGLGLAAAAVRPTPASGSPPA